MADWEQLRRRVAPAVLVAGLAVSLVVLGRSFPRDTEVVLRLEGGRADVRNVEVAFEHPGDSEPSAGARFAYSSGAPRTIRTTAHLATGAWDVVVTVERAGGKRTVVRRSARLDGGSVTLPVDLEPSDVP